MKLKLSKQQQKKFKLIDKLIKQYSDYEIPWGFNGLGYVIYKRTYSRWLESEQRTEEYPETFGRCVKQAILNNTPYTDIQIKRMFKLGMDLKFMFSGRLMWQAFESLNLEGYNDSNINCWYYDITSTSDIVKTFTKLCLGGGVGFSVRKRHRDQLPDLKQANVQLDNDLPKEILLELIDDEIKENGGFVSIVNFNGIEQKLYVVGDSRTGWSNLVEKILDCYFSDDENIDRNFIYNSNIVRKRGEKIVGFGGVASGAEPLNDGLAKICKIFDGAIDRKLGSVEIVDMLCLIGEIIISGNTRRTALLALGDIDDIDFITCKRFDLKDVPYYRANVNITVECNATDEYNQINDLPVEFWDSYRKLGECLGLLNLINAESFGRLGKNRYSDLKKYFNKINESKYSKEFLNKPENKVYEKDINGNIIGEYYKADIGVTGVNPCSEANLKSGQMCNLGVVFTENTKNIEEKRECLQYLYMCNKMIAAGQYLSDTEELNKSSRLGLDLCGFIIDLEQNLKDAEYLYDYIMRYDIYFSDKYNLSYSAKTFVTKPNGTCSLLAGTRAGSHYDPYEFYNRTSRFDANDPLIPKLRKMGYLVENRITKFEKNPDGTPKIVNGKPISLEEDKNTVIAYFPIKSPSTIVEKNVDAIHQLELNRLWQQELVNQSISHTVKYKIEELDGIIDYLKNNWQHFKAVSFLQQKEWNFIQMPLQEITEEEYNNSIKKLIPLSKSNLDNVNNIQDASFDLMDCDMGICPIK